MPESKSKQKLSQGSVAAGSKKTGGAKTSSRTSKRDATPNLATSIPVKAWEEEASMEDIEKAMRDNPGLRTPDATRRHLPPEEFPDGSQERKDAQKARDAVDKALEALEKVQGDIGSADVVLSGKVRDAVRLLKR